MVLIAGREEARSVGEDQSCPYWSLGGQRMGLEGREVEVEVRVSRAVSSIRRPKVLWDRMG